MTKLHKIGWILPSGRVCSADNTLAFERKIQDLAVLHPRVVFFFEDLD